jgi:glycosyltransferase involved in cell wall biosynthesis
MSSIKEELAILEQEKPDLVISRMDSYVYSPVTLTRKTNIPFIIEVDSPSSYEKLVFQDYYRSTRKLLYWLEQKVLEYSKAAFAQTNQVKNYYMEIGLPEDLFTVIPNGVDAERFHPDVDSTEVKDKFDLDDSLVIGFVGSFIYWHGVENLTTIMDNCVKNHSNVKFLMVGDGGPMKPYLEKYIKENNLSDKVILAGLVSHDEIPKYINAMDIVLAPYPKLDFFYYSPVKVFEYMACGKALITTDIGQISEIIQNGETGVLTTPNDINDVIENINHLIRDDKLRRKIGNKARMEIEKKHTWNIRGKQLSDLCEKHV